MRGSEGDVWGTCITQANRRRPKSQSSLLWKSHRAEVAKESEGFHSRGKTSWKVARRAQVQGEVWLSCPVFKVQGCIPYLGQICDSILWKEWWSVKCRSSGEVRSLQVEWWSLWRLPYISSCEKATLEPWAFSRGFSHGDRVGKEWRRGDCETDLVLGPWGWFEPLLSIKSVSSSTCRYFFLIKF